MAGQEKKKSAKAGKRKNKPSHQRYLLKPPKKPYNPVEGAGAFVKKAWRESSIGQKMGLSLKTFARTLSKQNTEAGAMARAWLANKRAA